MLHLTAEDFQTTIETNAVTVVDFWATWCMPCKMMAPLLEQLEQELPQVTVAKVDVDECMELAQQYQVQSIPDIVIFQNGSVFDTLVGVRPYESLKSAVLSALGE